MHVISLLSPEDLTRHLDRLNDGGTDPTVAGVDKSNNPFLAMLRGPYAGEDIVLFNTPWDSDTETIRGYRCDECSGQEPARFADLHFPVRVLEHVIPKSPHRPKGLWE